MFVEADTGTRGSCSHSVMISSCNDIHQLLHGTHTLYSHIYIIGKTQCYVIGSPLKLGMLCIKLAVFKSSFYDLAKSKNVISINNKKNKRIYRICIKNISVYTSLHNLLS